MNQKKENWIIAEILNWTKKYFAEKKINNPKLSAELLLAHVLGMKRLDLYLNFDKPLSTEEKKYFKQLIQERLLHKPIQYIIGKTEFYGYEILVNENVLIPRPETELAAEKILQVIKSKNCIDILDIGTGSGIIPIVLAMDMPYLNITAADISEKALKTAKLNIERYNLNNIKLVRSDLFSNLSKNIKYDLIFSNPPYIKTNVLKTLQKEVVEYEPLSALDGGETGLKFYIQIFKKIPDYLKENGTAVFEIGFDQKNELNNLAAELLPHYKKSFLKDYNGITRILILEK